MKLRTWREQEKKTLRELEAPLGKSKSSIARLETGETLPLADFFRRTFAETAGAVTPNDFYDLSSAADPKQPSEAPGPAGALSPPPAGRSFAEAGE